MIVWFNPILYHFIMQAEVDKKILIVDDEPGMVRLITKILEREGYSIDGASNGAEALDLAASKEDYSLIISDITMPHMSGLEFFKSLKKVKPEIPIILISGHASFDFAVEALNLGALAFLVKPFENAELIKWVNRVMGLHKKRHARDLLFERLITEKHEMELDSATVMEGNNLHLLAGYMAERFKVCKSMDKLSHMKIELAIHEALRNSIEHGNLELSSSIKNDSLDDDSEDRYESLLRKKLVDPKYAQSKIILRFSREARKISLSIEDEGEGFDHHSLLEARTSINSCHGRGLLLIGAGVDDVSYNESGNKITLSCSVS